ncbi:MAG: ATP phosphoribosyltransferase regulatory subunit, partial [Clostridiales bacterium]|nr:ATP phosphoribosyltransferase regulatory subunit [Clostridiales bacterium]
VLEYAKSVISFPRAIKAIERLESLYEIMKDYGFEKYISFDLGMLSKYDYYTGIIFKAYTYKTGEAIVTGGRYDNLVGQFGKDCPAIGLAIVIDNLMLALSRQKLLPQIDSSDTMILYTADYRKEAIALAGYFRKEGNNVVLQRSKEGVELETYLPFMKNMNIGGLLYIDSDKDILVMDASDGSRQMASIKELMDDK